MKVLFLGEQKPGVYTVFWNGKKRTGRNVPKGIYFCQLNVNGEKISKKIILLR
jgi:flagellar hook assembly protein FlgD